MGFFSFLLTTPASRTIQHDLSFDLTTTYPPRASIPPLPTSAPNTPPIPLEIVLNILEASYFDDALAPNTALLSACSLVSKSWSPHAQKLLFKHVTLRTNAAYTAFCQAVDHDNARARMLGAAVLRMRVVLDAKHPDALTHASFANALTLCPNLYDLNLVLYASSSSAASNSSLDLAASIGASESSTSTRPPPALPSFSDHTLSLLAASPKISSFHFTNWSNDPHAIFPLLDLWPSIRSLAITGPPPTLPTPTIPTSFAGSLNDLRINCQSPPSLDFFDWLLHSSALRSLEFERDPPASVVEYFADTQGGSLISLALPTLSAHEFVGSVTRMTVLKELRTENPWTCQSIHGRLPSTMQHLALGLDLNTPLQSVLDLVKRCRRSDDDDEEGLRAVTLLLWNNGEKHPQLPALKMACAYKGVDLLIMKDVAKMRTLGRGDPVGDVVFPREKTIENYKVMCAH